MKEHNEIVVQALNDYLKVDKPGYAILIKGDWGCGKSFFVKKWKEGLENANSNQDDEEDVIRLKPIYVSLNGVCSITQIDDIIKRAISPFLHGKFMKGLGKVFKLAASVALRVNVDLIGNDDQPEQMVCTIDPKTLLDFDPAKVKGQRILIFDDIERAKLQIDEVLGYINYFVEQAKCHVVIVGDTENMNEKDTFKKIKEKTIGHEYRIEEEVEEALNVFIKDISINGELDSKEFRNLISYCFAMTKARNLRILRQSLFDYKMYVSHLPKEIVEAKEFRNINLCLLANFIVIYAEYKGGYLEMENFNKQLVTDMINRTVANQRGEKETPLTPAANLMAKYQQSGLTESYRVLNQGYVDSVLNYLRDGEIDDVFLRTEVKRDRSTPWEKLRVYSTLSNEDFKSCLGETAYCLEEGNFESIDIMLMATCCMLVIVKKEMTYDYSTDKLIGWCVNAIENKYFPLCKTQNELYSERGHAHRCLSYYQSESIVEEVKILNQRIEEVFNRVILEKKDSLTVELESLTDEKIEGLESIYLKAVPDHSVIYSNSAIFSQVDEAKFVNGFVKLSNASKVQFISFVKYHYNKAFAVSNAKEFIHYYEADLKKLPMIVKLLRECASAACLVDKHNILDLIEVLNNSGKTIKVLLQKNDEQF